MKRLVVERWGEKIVKKEAVSTSQKKERTALSDETVREQGSLRKGLFQLIGARRKGEEFKGSNSPGQNDPHETQKE